MMPGNSVLEIFAYGAWNGGVVVDNSVYEKKNLKFKGGIPVNNKTIVERMGVRTRRAAGTDERIGVTALQDLSDSSGVDPSRIKLVIGATNVGDDKYDPVMETAQQIFKLGASNDIDGIIIDNHLGSLVYRVPATAARVQHALVELIYPEEKDAGTVNRFKEALEFYDQHMNSFAPV